MPSKRKRRSMASVPAYHPDWLVLNELSSAVMRALRRYAGPRLVDVGCGEKPYRSLAPTVDEWIGVDRDPHSAADLLGDAYCIPLESESVDTVLCTQVLEHVEEPHRALIEMRRVLRPGGILILTAPQYWPLHEEPRDFFRYTTPGLMYLMEKTEFEVVHHEYQGRGAAVAGQALNNAILILGEDLPVANSLWFKALKAPLYLGINLATVLLARLLNTDRDVLNHLLVVRK